MASSRAELGAAAIGFARRQIPATLQRRELSGSDNSLDGLRLAV
jgi:hypothetical protein